MELSVNDLRELIGTSSPTLGLQTGMSVVIRTVTYHYTGVVDRIGDGRVRLSTAGWLADSGRWSEFLKTGEANEVEMYPRTVSVAIASVVDWSELDVLPKHTN